MVVHARITCIVSSRCYNILMKPYNYNPRHPNRIKALKDRNKDPLWILLRFWCYVELPNKNDCWIWSGSVDGSNYGILSVVGEHWRVHRFSYYLYNGRLKRNIQVLHKCDVSNCVNPEHLFTGTQADNIKDMVSKNRHRGGPVGELNHASKLTNKQAQEILSKYKPYVYSSTRLGREYGVSHEVILSLVKGRTWKFLKR